MPGLPDGGDDRGGTFADPARHAITEQPPAHPDCDCARGDERGRGLDGHAAGRHERDLGERAAHLAHEARACRRGGEELDRGRACPPCPEDLGRRRAPGECGDAAAGRPRYEFLVEVRHHEEGRAGVDRPGGRLDRQDRPGADLESEVTGEVRGRFDRCEGGVLRLIQRQLECTDATGRQGLGDRRDRGWSDVPADGDDAHDEQSWRDRRSRHKVGQVVRLRLLPVARSVLDSVAPAYHRGVRTVTLAELAEEAGAPVPLVERLVAMGQVKALSNGRFDPRDEAVIGTVRALLEAGIPEDDVDWLVHELGGGFEAVGGMFEPPDPRASGTYADLRVELGALGDRLPGVFAAFGLPEPAPDQHLRLDEERVIRGFLDIWHIADPGGDADLRVARLAGETSRRLAEGWLDAWDDTARPELGSQGAPGRSSESASFDPSDPDQNPSLKAAVVGRELVRWLHERQVEQTLNRRIIDAVENALVGAGRLQARPVSPPAIAFVDLSGFTALTMEHGDVVAADVAGRLQTISDHAVRDTGGRVVELLGDGVLLRFSGAADAIRTVLRLVADVQAAGLPPAHAGIAAGLVVVRDGDVYGQTVNLAARIAGHAGPGQVVVDEGAVIALPTGTATFAPLGRVRLKGIPDEVGLWLATPAGDVS